MKRNFKFLFLVMIMVSFLMKINCLEDKDIKITYENGNTVARYNNIYYEVSKMNEDINDFNNFVIKKNGIILSNDTKKIINKINTIILKDKIEANDVSKINEKIEEIRSNYALLTTSDTKYDVVLESLNTIEKTIKQIEYKSGVLGEFDSEEDAKDAIKNNEIHTDDYTLEGAYERQRRYIKTDTLLIDEMFDTKLDALLYLGKYNLNGYSTNYNLNKEMVTLTSKENKLFSKISEIKMYKKLLELQGYDVSTKFKGFDFEKIESDKLNIDETFSSLSDSSKYMISLARDYNNIKLKVKNESYNKVTDTSVSQVFTTEEDARNYLNNLKKEYKVTNDSITRNDDITYTYEDVTKYFLSNEDANNYLNSLSDFTLKDTSIKKLSADEIDMKDIISNGDTNLNTEDKTYSYMIFDLNTKVNVNENGNIISSDGTVTIKNVKLNGQDYDFNLINKMPVSNNSVVSINGSVTYCSRRGKLFCLGYTTKDFNTYGVLNKDYNVSRLNNLFKYTINNIDIDDSKVIVDDNLVDIYRLNTTKVIENKDPKYVVSADIYKIERVHKYRVVGTVSNITINPKYKIEFTKTKNVLKYHLVGLAKKDIYKDIYVVTYNLKKMTEEKEIKYIQNFKVVEVKNYYSYSLSLLAHLNLNGIGGVNNDNNINIPNTGLNDKDYSIMIILLIITIVISIKLIFKRNS